MVAARLAELRKALGSELRLLPLAVDWALEKGGLQPIGIEHMPMVMDCLTHSWPLRRYADYYELALAALAVPELKKADLLGLSNILGRSLSFEGSMQVGGADRVCEILWRACTHMHADEEVWPRFFRHVWTIPAEYSDLVVETVRKLAAHAPFRGSFSMRGELHYFCRMHDMPDVACFEILHHMAIASDWHEIAGLVAYTDTHPDNHPLNRPQEWLPGALVARSQTDANFVTRLLSHADATVRQAAILAVSQLTEPAPRKREPVSPGAGRVRAPGSRSA